MTKLQNLFVPLVNMDTLKMTLKISLFTVDFKSNLCYNIVRTFCVCRHAECLQMYAVSAPFDLVLNFLKTFSKLKPAYGRAPHSCKSKVCTVMWTSEGSILRTDSQGNCKFLLYTLHCTIWDSSNVP